MVQLNLYSAGNLTAPPIPVDPDLLNLYSVSSSKIWFGLGRFGESLDILVEGSSLDTPYGIATGVTGYINGSPYISVYDFYASYDEVEEAISSGFSGILDGDDTVRGSTQADTLIGGSGSDEIFGFGGNDNIHGNFGPDYIDAGAGNDVVRGGNGLDTLIGGDGSDWLWGGQGANQVFAGNLDGDLDQVFVPADSTQNVFGNPGGINADVLFELESSDQVFIHGVSDSALSFSPGTFDLRGNSWSGIGIYANGSLEAVVAGSNLNALQVDAMTQGGFFA